MMPRKRMEGLFAELDGRLRAMTGNRCLFVMRVLACTRKVEKLTVVLLDQRVQSYIV